MLGYIFQNKTHKKNPIRGSLNITPRESWAPEIEKTAVAAERLCSTGVGLTVHVYFPGKWYLCRNKMITLSLHLPLHSALQWPAHNMDPENTKPTEILQHPFPNTSVWVAVKAMAELPAAPRLTCAPKAVK